MTMTEGGAVQTVPIASPVPLGVISGSIPLRTLALRYVNHETGEFKVCDALLGTENDWAMDGGFPVKTPGDGSGEGAAAEGRKVALTTKLVLPSPDVSGGTARILFVLADATTFSD